MLASAVTGSTAAGRRVRPRGARALGPGPPSKLNQCLVSLYDPSGRLFFASEDPIPVNRELTAREQELNLKYGVVTINEVRSSQGLPSVPWGDVPWLPRVRKYETLRALYRPAASKKSFPPAADASVTARKPKTMPALVSSESMWLLWLSSCFSIVSSTSCSEGYCCATRPV